MADPLIAEPAKQAPPPQAQDASIGQQLWSAWVQPSLNDVRELLVNANRTVSCWSNSGQKSSPSELGYDVPDHYKALVQAAFGPNMAEAFKAYASVDICSGQMVLDRGGLATLLKNAGYKGGLSMVEAAKILNGPNGSMRSMDAAQFERAFAPDKNNQALNLR